MALTVEQIEGHISHFNTFRELPREVMHELFASAMTVALLSKEKGNVASAIESVEVKIVKIEETEKPNRTTKAKE